MKPVSFLLCLCFLIFYSCSNDESDNQSAEQPSNNNNNNNIAEVKINGELVANNYFVDKKFYKVEDEFYIIDGLEINKLISFNKNGEFGSFSWNFLNNQTNTYKVFYSYNPFSSHFFRLNIEEIDEVNKKIKINFNGEMYGDPNSLQSEGKYVNGRIVADYIDVIPAVFGLKNTAKINGQNWTRTNSVQENGVSATIQNEYNDKEYRIRIFYRIGITSVGTYNFTSTDQINKVEISKYDLITNSYINYNCTGQLKILNIFQTQIKGEYSFTGVNPNNSSDVVTVTNGEFKIISVY
jgi:hypothetical protein